VIHAMICPDDLCQFRHPRRADARRHALSVGAGVRRCISAQTDPARSRVSLWISSDDSWCSSSKETMRARGLLSRERQHARAFRSPSSHRCAARLSLGRFSSRPSGCVGQRRP
jgi:hypothetical protein